MSPKQVLYLMIFLFVFQNGHTQVQKTIVKDSTKIMYQNIEDYSNKSNFRKFLHKLIFNSTKKTKPIDSNFKQQIDKKIGANKGKIIRNIIIESLDPFGFSVEDEEKEPKNSIEKFGNKVHIKSKKWTIRNQLLFKKNQPLDSLLIKESERLIRRQRFVRSVIIKTITLENSIDSVDISIRVLDSWSLIPNGAISNNKMNFEITERNFLGFGQEFENDFGKRFSDNQNSYSGKYSFNNIKNTFINASFLYENSFINDVAKSALVERTFFSPLTKYAGGVYYETRKFTDSLPTILPEFEKIIIENETKNVWFGYASKLFNRKSIDYRTTNFVTTVGYKNIKYLKNTSFLLDPNQFLSNEELYLVSFGITTRKFIQDKYLFNFDIVEDVPFGKVYALTTGFQNKNNRKSNYLGGRFSYGHYYNFGYLSSNVELGSFFYDGKTHGTTLKIEGNYFTRLLLVGNWKIRQFIKPSLVVGINRVNSIKDRVTLDGTNGFDGFTNPLFNGTRKLSVVFQTQTYAPGTWKGFHFSPFLNTSFGLLGNSGNVFLENTLYSKFTLGVLINNDYLVFNRFQISLSFYPTTPFSGSNVFRTNTLENDDFNIPDYTMGQPNVIEYK